MADRLAVDTDRLKKAADELDQVATEAEDLFKRVQDQVGSYEGCWGTTTTGKQFEQGYGPKRDEFMASMENVSSRLKAGGSDVRNTATNLINAEKSAEHISLSLPIP